MSTNKFAVCRKYSQCFGELEVKLGLAIIGN